MKLVIHYDNNSNDLLFLCFLKNNNYTILSSHNVMVI